MGTKENPGEFDCYSKALPNEPMFVLLARDPYAPELIDQWAVNRARDIVLGFRPLADLSLVDEAQDCARKMREWRKKNDGKWRTSPSTP